MRALIERNRKDARHPHHESARDTSSLYAPRDTAAVRPSAAVEIVDRDSLFVQHQ
jgi:hypothetical protein